MIHTKRVHNSTNHGKQDIDCVPHWYFINMFLSCEHQFSLMFYLTPNISQPNQLNPRNWSDPAPLLSVTKDYWCWHQSQNLFHVVLVGALEGVKARQTHTKEKNAASLWEPQPTRTSRLLRFYILNLKECILNASTFYNLVQVCQWEQGLFSQMNNWAIATLFIYWLFHRICFLYKIFKLCWKCSKGDQVIHFNMYLCKHIILT